MTTTTPVMQKNVTVKVYNTVTKTYEVVELTKDGQITTIKATKNVNYEFFDHSIGRAPNHIITRRKGKDLHVSFEREGGQDDLVIEDFYEIADQSHSLIGIAEDDGYYYYIPDTGEVPDYVTQLADGDAEGHALGGERLAAPLFILPPPVGFPWWLGVGVIPFLPRKDKIWPQPEPKPEPIKGGLAKPDSASRDKVEDVTQNVTENDDGVQNNTVKLIDPVTGKMSKTVNVIGQGVWTVEADGSRVTFKPNPGFDANPTPINYVITDKAGNVLTAPVAVNYNKQLTADYKAGVSGQPVEVDVLGNDNSGVDPKTVRLIDPNNPSNPPALEVKVPNEGTWTVDPTTGKVTFTPNPDFKGDPTVIHYVAKDTNGNDVPSKAPITVDYPTVADPDSKVGKPNEPVTQNVTDNDNPDVDPATIKLIDPKNPTNPPSDKVVVPNEGIWTVDDKGNVTFTPDPSFKGNPTPIQYVSKDKDGSDVPPAAVSVIYYALSASAPFARSNSKSGTEAREPVTQKVAGNDTGIDPSTIKLIDPTTKTPTDTVTVAGEGVWTLKAGTDEVTFTSDPSFKGNPTPITYTGSDVNGTPIAKPAEVRVSYSKAGPAASDDVEVGETGQPTTVNVAGNDSDTLDPTTIKLIDPTTNQPSTTVTVPNEGTWTVDDKGNVTFTPDPSFKGDPTPIQYTASDKNGTPVENPANIIIDYPTVATPDVKVGKPGEPVTQNVTGNDNPDVDPATIKLIDPKNPTNPPSDKVTVPNEGTWTVDDKGNVTFTPEGGFKGDPTPIQYVGKDKDGHDVPPTTVDVAVVDTPVVTMPDSKPGKRGDSVTQDVTKNDTDIDRATIKLIDPNNPSNPPSTSVTVPGQGTWTVDDKGNVTFSPETGFDGDPDPINYVGNKIGSNEVSRPTPVHVSYPEDVPVVPNTPMVGIKATDDKSVEGLDPTLVFDVTATRDPKDTPKTETVTVKPTADSKVTPEDIASITYTDATGKETTINTPEAIKDFFDNGVVVGVPANKDSSPITITTKDDDLYEKSEPISLELSKPATGTTIDPTATKADGKIDDEPGNQDPNKPPFDPNNPTNPGNNPPPDTEGDKPNTPMVGIKATDDKSVEGLDPTLVFDVTATRDPKDTPKTETVTVKPTADSKVTPEDIASITYTDATGKETTINTPEAIKDFFDNGVVVGVPANKDSSPITITTKDDDLYEKSEPISLELSKPATGTTIDPTATKADGKIDDEPGNQDPNKPPFDPNNPTNPGNNPPPDTEGDKPNTPMVGIKATDDKSVEGLDPTLVFDVTATRDPKDTPKTETVTVKPTADSKVTPEDIASITYTDATGKETTINTPEAIKDFFDNGVVVGVPANKDSSPITITTKDDDLYEKSEPISLELSKPATGTTIDPTATKADGKIDDEPGNQDPNKPPFDPNNPTNPGNNPPPDTEGDKPNTPMVGIKATDDKSVEGLDPTLVFDVTATRDPKDTPKTETVTVKPTADSKVTPEDIASITYTDATGKETTINTPEAIKDFFDNGVVVGVPANKDSSPITITTKDDDLYEKSEPISLELSKPATGTTIDPTATKADGKIDDEPGNQDPNKPPFDPNNPTNPGNNPPPDTEGDKPNTPMVGIKATDDKSVEGLDPTLVFDVTATRDPKDTPKTETVTVKPTADSKVTPEDIASITYTDATGKETTINTPEAIKDFFDNGVVVGVPANKDSSPITITTKDDDLYEKSEPISLELSKPATGTTIDPTATKADGKIDDEPGNQDPNKPPFDPNNPTNPGNNPPPDTEGDKPNTPMVGIKATDDKSVEGLDPTLVFDVTATRDPKDTPKTETVTVKPTADSKVTPEDIASITYTDATGKETTINTPEAIKDFFDNGVVVGVPANKDSSPITITTKDDDLYEKSEPISLELSKPATGTTIDPTATKADGKIDDEPGNQDPNKPPFDPNDPTNPGNNPPPDTEGDKPTVNLSGPDNVLETAGKATYTFTLADGKTSTEDIVIKYKVTVPQATDTINPAEAADFGANTLEVEKEVVLKAGQPSVTVDVPIAHDTVYEGKETYEVVMTAVTGANKGTDKVTTTINDFDGETDGNKDKPTLELTPPTHVSEEGLPGGRPDKVSLNKQDAHNIDETNAVSGTHDDWDVTDKTTTTGYIKINNVDVSDTRLVNNLSVVLDKDNATKLTANKEPLTWKEETVGSQQVYTATNPKGEAVLEVKVDKVGKEGEGADAGKLVFAYTSTLLKPIDHSNPNGEDNLPVNFNVKLQDNKADVISENKAVVIVEDDMPEKDSVVHNIQVGHDHVVLTGLEGGFTNTVFTKPAVLTATSNGQPFTDRNDPSNTEIVTRGKGFLVGDGVETLDNPKYWQNGPARTEDGYWVEATTIISNGHNGSGKRNSSEIGDDDKMTDALYWGRPVGETVDRDFPGSPKPATYPTNGNDAKGNPAVMQPGYILKDNDEFKGTKEQTLEHLTKGFTLGEFIHDNYPSSGDVGTLVTTDLTSRFKVLVNDVDGKAPDIKFPMLHLETSNAMDNKHMYSDDVIILKQPKETIKIGSTTYRLKIEGVESKSSTNKDLDLIKAARTLYETLDYTARAELKTETEGLLATERAKPQPDADKIAEYEATLADIAAESKRSPFSHQITSAENRNLLLGKGEASNAYKADWNGKTNITLYEALKDWAASMRSAEEALENSERHKKALGTNADITNDEVIAYMRALDQNDPEQKALYDRMLATNDYTTRKNMMLVEFRVALEKDITEAYLNAAGKLDELKALLEAFDISLFSSPETFSNKFDIKAKLEPVSKGLDLTTSVDIQNKIHTGGDTKNVEVTWDGAGVTTDPSSGTATLTNKYGTFIGNKDGSYKFVAVENIAEMVAEGAKAETENFELSYTYKDNDGDVVTSNIKFNFTGLTKDEMKTARNHTGEGDSNDYFVGSTKADIIDGRAGDDTIVGNGGGDTLIGGLGNDVIFYDEGASIYGDEQDVSVVYKDDVDTLSLVNFTELNNAPIDFTNIANVKGVEVIDMTNDLAQQLNITLSSVLDMTDDRNTLFVKGDEAGDNKDTINAQGFSKGSETKVEGDITYELYTSGEAKLYIEQGINVIL